MDGRGWNTGNQPPVKNNMPDSPFEEPEQAPELRDDRSEHLYSRDEPFWNRVVDAPQAGRDIPKDANYWNHPDVMDTDHLLFYDNDTKLQKLRKFLGSGAVKRFLVIFAIVVVAAVILYSALFQVRAIHVTGNTSISEQEIIRLSGLQVGQNSMTIDDEAVMRKVEGNRYLRCTLVDVHLDTVTIHVRERVPKTYLHHNGMTITLDNRGYVLEETLDSEATNAALVKVTGLSVRRSALGQKLNLSLADQLETYTKILVELEAMKGLSMIRELDMTSMDSIYLVTRDDYQVRLGDENKLHEKLRAFMITKQALAEMSDTRGRTGTIDVADPAEPSFMPDKVQIPEDGAA